MTDDIKIEDIRIDTRFETGSPMNQETPYIPNNSKSKGFFSTKRGKKIIFGMLGIVIIGIVIGVIIGLKKKKTKSEPMPDPEPNPNPDSNPQSPTENNPPSHPETIPEPNPSPDSEPDLDITSSISHKVNEVLIYDDSYEKRTDVVLVISTNSNSRRLDESNNIHSQTTKYTTKYLINVYDYNDSENVYYAYAAIIKMTKKIEQRIEENLGGNDLRNNITIGDDVPAAQFTFNKDGNIISFNQSPNINTTLAAYLYEFVQKVIPQISKESFSGRRLEKGHKRTYDKTDNEEIIITDVKNDESENPFTSTWKTIIKEGKVKKIDETKKSQLFNNNSLQIELDKNTNNFTSDVQNDTNANRNSIIKQIITEISSKLTLSETETNDENEEISNHIKSILSNIKFKEYSKSTRRRLEIIPNKFTKLQQLRELETVEIETYAMPIYFTYPLFRSHYLGDKVGLSATLAFYPLDGQFNAQMDFYANGVHHSIFKESKPTNFHKIINNIISITQNVYLVIKENIENKILSHYQNSQISLNQDLENLYNCFENYPKINNVFNEELQKILNAVNSTIYNCYNAANDNTNYATDSLNYLKENIENDNEDSVIRITNNIGDTIDSFVENNTKQIKNLYNKWKSFYTSVLDKIPDLKDYINNNHDKVETGVYYNIKDGISKIIKIFSQFNEKLQNAIEIEKTQYKLYINKNYYKNIDPILRDAETVAEYAANNASVIDSMNNYWGTNYVREEMIKKINNLRSTIVAINNLVYEKINNKFDSKLNENVFSSLLEEVNQYYIEINNDKNILLQQLKTLNKYEVNFNDYFEDMKLLDTIEKEINEIKKNSYKTYILDYLNSINIEPLDNNTLNEIKNRIHPYLINLKLLILDNDIDTALSESYSFSDIINQINYDYLGNNLLYKMNQTYGNADVLNTMLSNYFSVVTEAFTKFNTSFMDINYKNHNYTIKPTELVDKLLNISFTLAPINSYFFENIQTLILNKIYYKLYDANVLVIQIIEKEYNEFIKGIDDKFNGNVYYNKILDNIKSFKKKYYDNSNNLIPVTLYPLRKEDEFNIKEQIENYIAIIRFNIQIITDKINSDFKNYFCYGNDIICFTDSSVSSIDHYFYQAGKLRTAISSLESIIEIAESMIGDNVLSDLNSDDYKKEFEKELNYRTFDILEDIQRYLSELNSETKKYINDSIIDLKNDTISAFTDGINLDGLINKVYLIAKNTLVDPIALSRQIVDYLYYACGPISKLEVAFNEEITAYKIETNSRYRFNETMYRQSYNDALDNLNRKYYDLKEHVLDNIQVPSIIINDLTKKVNDFIEESYEEVLENLNTISDVTEFEFLNMTFSLKDISIEILNKEKNDLISEFGNNITSLHEEYLNILKENILSNIEKQYKTILKVLELELNATANKYNLNQTTNNYVKVIDSLDEGTIQQMDEVIELFFEKIKDVYSQQAIDEELYQKQYYVIKEYYPFEANFENFTSIISEDINEIIKLTNYRYLQEQRLFLSNIRGFFVDGFTKIANAFINNKGSKYLENLYTYDYQSNIYDDFYILKTSIIDITESIFMLLNTEELKALGITLITSIKPSLENIITKVNKTIIEKVDDIIYPKIEIFRNDSISKIVNLFVMTLKKDNNALKDFLDDKIYNLVPKTFNDSFAAELEAIFDNLISKKTDEMKSNYSSSINEDLTTIINTLNENGNRVSTVAASLTSLKTDLKWVPLQRAGDNILYEIKLFDDSFYFTLTDDKETNDIQFYSNEALNYIGSIKSGFDYQVWLGQMYIESSLSSFNVDDKVEELINNLNNSYFTNNINDAKSDLVTDFSLLSNNILGEFNDFKTLLENESKMYNMEGFEYKNRNLGESYNLSEIEEALQKIDEEYNKFKKNVTTSNIISEIITKKRGFITSLTNSASTLTNNFYAYQVLISQYTTFEKVEQFFKNLTDQSLLIQQKVSSFINSHTNLVDNILQTINNQMTITKTKINKGINDKINEALDYVFKNKFSQLDNINEIVPVDANLNFGIVKIIYYDSKEEIVQTVDLTLNGIDATNSYTLKKKNDFDFFMDINTYGRVNLTATIKVEDFFIEEIVGVVTHETIGIQTDYNLHDRSLDINGYVQPVSSDYKRIVKKLNEYGLPQNLFEIIETTPNTTLSMTKSYKKRIW